MDHLFKNQKILQDLLVCGSLIPHWSQRSGAGGPTLCHSSEIRTRVPDPTLGNDETGSDQGDAVCSASPGLRVLCWEHESCNQIRYPMLYMLL